MPKVIGGSLNAPFTGLSLTGAIAISAERSDGCIAGSCNCLVVLFVNGIPTKAFTYNPYGNTDVALPVSVPSDCYYNVVSGDVGLVACDASKLCSSTPFYRSIANDVSWTTFATYQPPAPATNSRSATSTEVELSDLRFQNGVLKARVDSLTKLLLEARSVVKTASEQAADVDKLIRSLSFAATCPEPTPPIEAPTPTAKRSNPCCDGLDDGSVGSLLSTIGYDRGDCLEQDPLNATSDPSECNPVRV